MIVCAPDLDPKIQWVTALLELRLTWGDLNHNITILRVAGVWPTFDFGLGWDKKASNFTIGLFYIRPDVSPKSLITVGLNLHRARHLGLSAFYLNKSPVKCFSLLLGVFNFNINLEMCIFCRIRISCMRKMFRVWHEKGTDSANQLWSVVRMLNMDLVTSHPTSVFGTENIQDVRKNDCAL